MYFLFFNSVSKSLLRLISVLFIFIYEYLTRALEKKKEILFIPMHFSLEYITIRLHFEILLKPAISVNNILVFLLILYHNIALI